jgi:thiol:disulfide interchange protein DsbC
MVLYIGNRYDKNGAKMMFQKTPTSINTIKDGISFSYGNGKKEIYIITDPECPYCTKLEKALAGKMAEYTVHVILYPLAFHKNAPAMVEWIMQGKDDAEKKHRMEELMVKDSKDYKTLLAKKGTTFKYTDAVKIKINNAKKTAKVLGMTGTPSVYNAQYNKINWKTLIR